MAAFGEKNFASPLGAVSPRDVFDANGWGYYNYSGYSGRSGAIGFELDGFSGISAFSGFSGFSEASGFSCNAQNPTFVPFRPTLTFPTSSVSLSGTVTVIWRESLPRDPYCWGPVTYEIQFTSSFSEGRGWRTLASGLEQGTTSYDVDVSTIPATNDGGIRIRARDQRNLFSEWSSNKTPFVVANHPPNPVKILSPLSGETFDNTLTLVWQEAVPKDVDGHRVFYRLQITPVYTTGQGWADVPNATSLAEGTVSFIIDVTNFPEGNDYGVRIMPYDELNDYGEYAEIGRLKIRHEGVFMIDTLPPVGNIELNDGDPFTNDRRIRIRLNANDATSGIKDVRLKNDGEDCWSDWDTYVPQKFWDLTTGDGIKRVLVQFRDYAGNVTDECDCEIISRVLCDEGNVTDLEVYGDKIYAAFDANGNLMEYKVLSRQAHQFDEGVVSAMATLSSFLYVATYSDPNTLIYRYDGSPQFVATISGEVSSMVAYNSKVYMGLRDGRVISLNGTSTTVVLSTGVPITRLRNDGTLLYVALESGGGYYVFDGTTWTRTSL